MIEKNDIKFPLLTSEDIEVKVKQITKSGALLLLYKTARIDAQILDDAVGPMNWQRDYKEIKGNLYCGIGIRSGSKEDYVWKWDCGVESGQDDGQEKKAEASDAFKRAATCWGIGRELYTSPLIWADVATVERNGKWVLENPRSKYVITEIEYNEETRKITRLLIQNAETDTVVFDWSLKTTGAIGKKMVKTIGDQKQEEVKKETPDKLIPEEDEINFITTTGDKPDLKTLVREIGNMVKALSEREGNANGYKKIVKEVTGDTTFKCNTATDEQYDWILQIRDKMVAAGYGI